MKRFVEEAQAQKRWWGGRIHSLRGATVGPILVTLGVCILFYFPCGREVGLVRGGKGYDVNGTAFV